MKVYFDGSAPDYYRDLKTYFVYSYIIPTEDVNMPFFHGFMLYL